MINSKTYAAILKAATQMDPYGKKLDDETIALMFMSLDDQVKQQVTDEMLMFAFKQHRMDPAPDKDLNIEQQILQHLYRCENGAPNFRWGLRKDLPVRMSASNTFHGQTKSPYQLGEDLGRNEPRFAPNGVLAQLAALPGGNALGSDLPRRD
jgi:hypothetical protein